MNSPNELQETMHTQLPKPMVFPDLFTVWLPSTMRLIVGILTTHNFPQRRSKFLMDNRATDDCAEDGAKGFFTMILCGPR